MPERLITPAAAEPALKLKRPRAPSPTLWVGVVLPSQSKPARQNASVHGAPVALQAVLASMLPTLKLSGVGPGAEMLSVCAEMFVNVSCEIAALMLPPVSALTGMLPP